MKRAQALHTCMSKTKSNGEQRCILLPLYEAENVLCWVKSTDVFLPISCWLQGATIIHILCAFPSIPSRALHLLQGTAVGCKARTSGHCRALHLQGNVFAGHCRTHTAGRCRRELKLRVFCRWGVIGCGGKLEAAQIKENHRALYVREN